MIELEANNQLQDAILDVRLINHLKMRLMVALNNHGNLDRIYYKTHTIRTN